MNCEHAENTYTIKNLEGEYCSDCVTRIMQRQENYYA